MIKNCVIFLIFLITSCSNSDYSVNLGNGYNYSVTGKFNNHINSNKQIYSNVDSIFFNKQYIIIHQTPIIKIIKYTLAHELGAVARLYPKHKKNKDSLIYKIIYNIDDLGLLYKQIKSRGFVGDNLENDKRITNIVSDSLLKNNSFYRKLVNRKSAYWIINKQIHKLYGPLNKVEFNILKKELKISGKLEAY